MYAIPVWLPDPMFFLGMVYDVTSCLVPYSFGGWGRCRDGEGRLCQERGVLQEGEEHGGLPPERPPPVLTSSDGYQSRWYAS